MRKFKIVIEETVVEEFEVVAANAEDAMRYAKEKYKSGEIVLSLGEVQFKQMAIVSPRTESTEWCEF